MQLEQYLLCVHGVSRACDLCRGEYSIQLLSTDLQSTQC